MKAAFDPAAGVLWLYDNIEGGEQLRLIIEALAKEALPGRLIVRINSAGGDVWAASALIATLERLKIPIIVQIDGLAASAAAIVAMAGDTVLISPLGGIYLHRSWASITGNCRQLRDLADILEAFDRQAAGYISRRVGLSQDLIIAEWLEGAAGEGTFFNAEEAVSAKLADKILSGDQEDTTPGSVEDRLSDEEFLTLLLGG